MISFKHNFLSPFFLIFAFNAGLGLCESSRAVAKESYFVDFGSVQVNITQSRYYTISNSGPEVLNLKKFDVSGIGFSAETDCDHPLAVNAKCTLRIDFQPPFEGLDTGSLDLDFDHDSMSFILQGQGARY
jgi:hypothetical protein